MSHVCGTLKNMDTTTTHLHDYQQWVDRQALSARSKTIYGGCVSAFFDWVDASGVDAFSDWASEREAICDDYVSFLLTVQKRKPRTVRLAAAAIDSLYRSRGLAVPHVSVPDVPELAPRALSETEQRRVWRRTAEMGSSRDQAILALFLYAGLRIGELVALDTDDVAITARKGSVIVRAGKGGARSTRTIQLAADARRALDAWSTERAEHAAGGESALFVSDRRYGTRVGARAVRRVVARLGRWADIDDLAPHTLRHTCLTRLARNTDVFTTQAVAGHASPRTTGI